MYTKNYMNEFQKESLIDFLSNYQGDIQYLNFAIGFYFIGKLYGWKLLYMAYSKKTVKKYADILNIDVRQEFPEYGTEAYRSKALEYVVQNKINFWKVASDEIKVKGRRTIKPSSNDGFFKKQLEK